MARDFIPQNEGQLIIWLENFKARLAIHGPTLGLLPADITALTAACTDIITKINAVETAKAALKNATETKDASKLSGLGLVRKEVKKMKTNNDYTDGIGDDLGVKSDSTDPDFENMKTTLSADTFPGYVRIKFTKKGFTAVNIYARLKGQTTWLFLARDTNSPYDDHRALAATGVAETREYMAIGLDGDDEVGQQSDIVSVVYGG